MTGSSGYGPTGQGREAAGQLAVRTLSVPCAVPELPQLSELAFRCSSGCSSAFADQAVDDRGARDSGSHIDGLGGVGAEYCVTSCDLGVFVDQAAEPVLPQNPGTCACCGRILASGGWVLVQRPVPMLLWGSSQCGLALFRVSAGHRLIL
jgi:hypothetical protein